MKGSQVFHNAKWIILCKIAQSVLQLVIGMISAQYLGPSNYGLLHYAASILAFFLPLMRLGLNATLVYELVADPDHEGEILGTSLAMNITSSILGIGGMTLVAYVLNPGEPTTVLLCALYGVSLLFSAREMIQYWFQYKLLSKYSSIAMLAAYAAVSAYKIWLLVSGKSVFWFAVSNSFEYGIIAVSLLFLYGRKETQRMSVSPARARAMLGRSKHYIFASLMVTVFQNTDQIMLKQIRGETENGYYAAALTAAVVAQFVFTAIEDSFRPMILAKRKEGDVAAYENHVSRLYGWIGYLTLLQSAVFTVLAPVIISILFRDKYAASVPVLRILTWYTAFSNVGAIRNIWLLAEEKQKYLPYINLGGALLNVAANAVMIPRWGASGAALASLLAQFFANFVLSFLIAPIRRSNYLLLRGLRPRYLIRETKLMLREMLPGRKTDE